jgi:hypothetical protein
MNARADGGIARDHDAEERRDREAALDRTIEASFPASDPPSSIPNPAAPPLIDDAPPASSTPVDGDALRQTRR